MLSDLCDPYSLVDEKYFMSKNGLQLANLLAIDVSQTNKDTTTSNIIKNTMTDNPVFVSFGEDGGYAQALLRAYSDIGGGKGIYLREDNTQNLDLEPIKKVIPEVEAIEDVLFDVNELEDEILDDMKNELEFLKLDKIDAIADLVKEEAENGAALVLGNKRIARKNLWNQEVELKPYFLYYAIAGMTLLERNGTMIIRIYDTHTDFSKTLIYLLSTNFTSTYIIRPYTMNHGCSDRFLICNGMINKNQMANEVMDNLKAVYNSLRQMHLDQSGDLDTLLINDT